MRNSSNNRNILSANITIVDYNAAYISVLREGQIRIQRGRLISVNEGKYVGNIPPTGYRRIKLDNDKGYSADNWKIRIAYRMARQARFENGETPKIDNIIPDMVPKAAIEWYIKNVLKNNDVLDFDKIVSMWEESLSKEKKKKEENNG